MKLSAFVIVILCFNFGLCVKNRKTTRDTRPNDVGSAVTYYDRRSGVLTIPIMVHLDRATVIKHPDIKKYRRKKMFRTVFKNIFKDLVGIYQRPSLNLTVDINLIDVRVLKRKKNGIDDMDASKYLRTYCTWQGLMKSRQKKLWYSILITGLDMFYMNGVGKEVRASTGRGYLKGMCSVNNSCTLLEWHPNHMPYILAHEMAHSLGVSHDGPPHNECRGQRYIMDALYDPHNPAKSWSPCSRRNLRQYLMSPRAWCLRPEGSHRDLYV